MREDALLWKAVDFIRQQESQDQRHHNEEETGVLLAIMSAISVSAIFPT